MTGSTEALARDGQAAVAASDPAGVAAVSGPAGGAAVSGVARTVVAGGRVPDFFIVGNPKCGTTALYEMLRRHPQVYMPECKEPHYLAHDPSTERATPAGHGRQGDERLPRTFEQYLGLFVPAGAEQLAGEASASYLRSPFAAERIAGLNPSARVVAILREPASFLRSLHLQHLQDHVERERDLRRAIANERLIRDGRTIRRYSDRVRYAEQLRRYEAALGRERMLVLVYDDFRADNAGTVRRVLHFLGIDDTVALEPVEANPTVRMRSVRMARSLHALRTGRGPLLGPLGAAVKALTPQTVRSRALRLARKWVLYGDPGAPDERLMAELRERFAPEVVALSKYLDRDLLSLWGYDRLD